MTSRTSLFNIGVFKNTIIRLKWGSILYFIILFFSVPFIILVEDFDRLLTRYSPDMMVSPLLLRSDYIIIPTLLAIVVPTVVAVLVFNNVHSSKQGVFVHGLPLTRAENYTSSVLAGLLLMVAPIVLNATVLLVMSFTVYGKLIASWTVIYWAALNLSIVFIMFSVAVFTGFLTGNAATHIGINVFVHVLPMLVSLVIFLISEIFLFGFMQAEGFLGNAIMENTPIGWLFGKMISHYRADINLFKSINIWIYLLGAIGVYWLGYIVYKRRKIEACGDVAAFKVFRPILKYAVSAAVAAVMFAILVETSLKALPIFTIAIVATAITYFAIEMLMNKSFKVFKATYKGYIAFLAACALFISFFAFTSVFGYETRIPKIEQIESAAVFESWSDEPHMSNEAGIIATIDIHKKLTEDIPVSCEPEDFRHLRVSYKLRNGKSLERVYKVSEETVDEALSRMYEFEDYKMKVTGFDNLNIENLTRLTLMAHAPSFGYNIALGADASEVMNAIKKDIKELSYNEIEKTRNILRFNVEFSYSFLENEKLKIFKTFRNHSGDNPHVLESFGLEINSNFKNTYNLLREKGYYNETVTQMAKSLYICKNPVTRSGDSYSYKGENGAFGEFQVNPQDLIPIEFDHGLMLANFMMEANRADVKEGKSFFVVSRSRDMGGNAWLSDINISFLENELPDYLKKYITQK